MNLFNLAKCDDQNDDIKKFHVWLSGGVACL